jgi:large subunit ribosomal protein L10
LQKVESSNLEGMLMYAFNPEDEVAAAQVLNSFAKQNPSLEFIGAINEEGEFLDAASVKSLADLPGKEQMIAGLINTLNLPMRGVISSLSGNLHGLLSGLEAKASN